MGLWKLKKSKEKDNRGSQKGSVNSDSLTNNDDSLIIDDNDTEPLSAQEMTTLDTSTAALLYGKNGNNVDSFYKFMGANPLDSSGDSKASLGLSDSASSSKTKQKQSSLPSLLNSKDGQKRELSKKENGNAIEGVGKEKGRDEVKNEKSDDDVEGTHRLKHRPSTRTLREKRVIEGKEVKEGEGMKEVKDEKYVKEVKEVKEGNEVNQAKETKEAKAKVKPRESEKESQKTKTKESRRKSLFGFFKGPISGGDRLEAAEAAFNRAAAEKKIESEKLKDEKSKGENKALSKGLNINSNINNDVYQDDVISPTTRRKHFKADSEDDEDKIDTSKLIIVKDSPKKTDHENGLPEPQIPESKESFINFGDVGGDENYFFAKHLNKKYGGESVSPPTTALSSPLLSQKSMPRTPNRDIIDSGMNIDSQLDPLSSPSSPATQRDSLIFERNVQEKPSLSRKSSFAQSYHSAQKNSPQITTRKSWASLRPKSASGTSPSSPVIPQTLDRLAKQKDKRKSTSSISSGVPPGMKAIPNHYVLDDYVSPALDTALNINDDGAATEKILQNSPRKPSIIEASLTSYLEHNGGSSHGFSSSSTSLLLKTHANGDITGMEPPQSPTHSLTRRGSNTFDISDAPPLPNLAAAASNASNSNTQTSSLSRRASLYVGVMPYARKKSVSSTVSNKGLYLPNFNRSLTELQNSNESRVKSATVSSVNTSTTSNDNTKDADIVNLDSYADLLSMEESMYSDANTAVYQKRDGKKGQDEVIGAGIPVN